MTEPDQTEYVAAALAGQRLSGVPIDLADNLRPDSEQAGYHLQHEANRKLSNAGLGPIVGHKIGCTTDVMQKFLAIHSPCAGDIFSNTIMKTGAAISRANYVRLGIECEIAVELSHDIGPGHVPFEREAAASAVGAVRAAIEIVDDRYRDYRTLGVPTLIADNFFGAGCMLGDPVRDWQRLDLAGLVGRTMINGQEAGRGAGAMVLGHPLEALAWLATSRAKRGLGLQRGAIILLGSLVETRWLDAGDQVRIEIDSLGSLDLSVTG